MNAIEKAISLKKDIEAYALEKEVVLPETSYGVIGLPVVDCESLIVAVANMNAPGDTGEGGFTGSPCAVPQNASFTIIISRDCKRMFDDEGFTIPTEAEKSSVQSSQDADFLWSWANQFQPFVGKTWDIGFAVEGGMTIVAMNLQTGID